jgi:hypothetical protein
VVLCMRSLRHPRLNMACGSSSSLRH